MEGIGSKLRMKSRRVYSSKWATLLVFDWTVFNLMSYPREALSVRMCVYVLTCSCMSVCVCVYVTGLCPSLWSVSKCATTKTGMCSVCRCSSTSNARASLYLRASSKPCVTYATSVWTRYPSHTHTHTYTDAHLHTRIHTHIYCANTYTRPHMHKHTRTNTWHCVTEHTHTQLRAGLRIFLHVFFPLVLVCKAE